MRLPRLQYTYAVFYAYTTQYNKNLGIGRDIVDRPERISKGRDLRELECSIVGWNLNKGFTNVILNNYKLLSIKMIWR